MAGSVLAASLLMGLTACGGSDSSDTIKSVDSSPTHSAKNKHKPSSSSPSSSGAPTGKPTFDFPQDVKVKVDTDKTGAPVKDKILRDHKYAMLADQASLAKGKPVESFGLYWTGIASVRVSQDYAKYKKKSQSITGKDHFYDRAVKSHTKKSAVVAYCEDQTKIFDKDKESGKAIGATFSSDGYISMKTLLRKSKFGIWQVYSISGTKGDKECQSDA